MTEDAHTPTGSAPEAAIEFAHRVFDAAREGATDDVLGVVDAGGPVDLANSNGDTLLLLAAYRGHAALVEGLLARGADVDHVNERGQTALACALFKQSAECVRALLRAGADATLGSQPARAIVQFFALPEMGAVLDEFGV